MRKGFVYLMAVSVCLALAFTPLMADRTADRTKSATRTAASGSDWTATVGDQVYRPNNGARIASQMSTNKAAEIVAEAASLEGAQAASVLMQVVRMDLPQNVETEKLLGDVYEQLGNLYEGTAHKQVHWYSLAMQYNSDPGARAELGRRIDSLGGDSFALSVQPSTMTANTREFGYDTCDTAMAVALPFTTNMSIVYWGDHDWFAFDLAGPDGAFLQIWTCHPDPFTDTTLELHDGCPGTVIAANDDWFSGPADPCYPAYYLSNIETGCMAPGTYYVEVGGWLDFSTPQDFDLTIEITGTCVLPEPDSYEPDDVREDAADIGHPTSIPQHANGWGRAKKEIQSRNIFPVMNSDFVAFKIERNEIVTMETGAMFPTFFNDFTTVGTYDNPDTYIELYYGIEPNYGGLCNNDGAFGPWCVTDADCEGLIINPLPNFPDCVPMQFFTVGGGQYWFWENPLAFNDDGGAGFASLIQACLPRGDQQTTSGTAAGDWLVRVWPYSSSATFDYQVMVKNETPCDFETEPNNDFPYANPLVWGLISGITDQSLFGPSGADVDLYSFDVPYDAIVNFETWGPDPYQSDNALELYVGPDDYGFYYYTGVSNDDCYAWLSCIEDLIIPPANDLLGNMYADADYLLNVTTWWLNKNFLYSVFSDYAEAPVYVYEVEPNDTCPGQGVALGDVILGGIHDYYVYGYCDYDSYTFTVTANSLVTLETDGGIDSTIALYDGTDYLGCDDDNGPGLGSMLQGCLPPGNYCAQVRTYGYWTTGAYQLAITDGGVCAPSVPVYLGETGLRCDGGQAEFETCPN